MLKLLILAIFVFALASCQTTTWDENTSFINNADLGANVQLQWNFTTQDIYIKLVVQTDGWVGFGLSPNGAMQNADMILAWTNPDGTTHFKDSHSSASGYKVSIDTVQNWKRLFYSRVNGATTVIFTRALKICVSSVDQLADEVNINIEPSSHVIWAYGDSFRNNFPGYHASNRGSKSLPLLATLNQRVELDMTQIEEAEFVVDVNDSFIGEPFFEYIYTHFFKI